MEMCMVIKELDNFKEKLTTTIQIFMSMSDPDPVPYNYSRTGSDMAKKFWIRIYNTSLNSGASLTFSGI